MRKCFVLSLIPMLACAHGADVVQRATVPPPVASRAVLAIVRVKPPWYAPRFVIRNKLRDAVPTYEAMAELDAKYFTIGDDGRYGGLYLWSERSVAEAYYNEGWREDIRKRRGVEPEVSVYDAPFVFEGAAHANAPHRGERSIDWPATATLTWWPSQSIDALALAREAATRQDAMHGTVVRDGDQTGVMVLWASRAGADRYIASKVKDHPPLRTESFEVPVAIDRSLR